jgi:hypothetical protein
VTTDPPPLPGELPLPFPDWPRDSVAGPWATPADAALYWPDSTALNPAALTGLLEAASDLCRAYAPPTAALAARHTQATVFAARDLWNARQADYPTGDLLAGDVTYTPRAMSPQVRRLLRPDIGVVVG